MTAAAAMFAACSDDAKELNAPELATNPTEEVAQGQVPVLFDSYVNRATTRAGATGDQTKTTLQKAWNPGTTYGGFGVFAYYTDNNDYDQLATPNFFYNQLVKWDEINNYWKYDPVRYWPNEYGSTAISDDADRISFFAYAPYVQVNPSSGKLTTNNNGGADESWGITGMSRNTASGDPIIKYIGSFKSSEAVDLVWGVNNTATWPLVNGGNQEFTSTIGLPWLNVERPAEADTQSAAAQRVKFQFMHALAKLHIQVNTFTDGITGADVDSDTKVWIRSVRFKGFAMKGALNLNNEKANEPYWMNYNGVGDLESDGEVIVYDGRKDGKEAMTNAEASNEKVKGLNPQFIEDEKQLTNSGWLGSSETGYRSGVTGTLSELFEGGGVFYVIPTDDQVEIEITYDVETIDGNLGARLSDNATSGSSIENCITKNITFGGGTGGDKLEAGKAYVINLHLGMNSVKFDADVKGWEDVSPVDVNMPANVQFFGAASPQADNAVIIPYNETDYQFGISGLNGGEVVNAVVGINKWNSATATCAESTSNAWIDGWSTTPVNANASGFQVFTLTSSVNTTTVNRKQVATWTGATSGKGVQMTFTQLAAPLALQAPLTLTPATGSSYDYQLRRTGANYGFFCTGIDAATFAAPLTTNGDPETGANGIKVWRNGNKLNYVTALTNNGDFTFDDSGKITVQENFAVGDVIKVVLKTGDAPAETITWTVEAAAAP